MQAFYRATVFLDKIDVITISGGTGAQHIIEGKEDTVDDNVAAYTKGSQVDVTASSQDEIVINLDRPQYIARRIDKFEEAVANYDVLAMNLRQIGSKLANVVDRKCAAGIEGASLATGLVTNGDGTVIVNTAMPGGAGEGATIELQGDAIAEAIYAGIAAIRENDDLEELFVALNPTNYSIVVQSSRAVNADFTNGNGGFDTGKVYQVGGATIIQSTNIPATAGLIGLVFGRQAAGMTKLWDVVSKVTEQADFLDAKLITGYFSNGVGSLRAESAASLKNV